MRADFIARFLPEFWRRARRSGSPIDATLLAMEGMLAPVERRLETIDELLDPRRCPSAMLPFLADMMGFAPLLAHHRGGAGALDDRRLRRFLIAGPQLAEERGTRAGLERALALATGCDRFAVDETADAAERRGFHVIVRGPAEARAMTGLAEDVVRIFKPAHVTHEIRFEQAEGAG